MAFVDMISALASSAGSDNPMSPYLWIVIVGGIASVIMAFGMGANDVANTFGPSVGAKTLTLKQAVMFASVFEFTGSVLMGGAVVDTVSRGIADPEMFADTPEVLMLGMFTSLVAAGIWLLLATSLSLSVSTTHSVIGSIIGFSLVAGGPGAILWGDLGLIVASWFISPVLSGSIAAATFWSVRRFILRKENSLTLGYYFYPLLIATTVAVNVFFITYKGPFKGVEEVLPVWAGILVSIGAGIVLATLIHFLLMPFIRRYIEKGSSDEEEDVGSLAATAPEDYGVSVPINADASALSGATTTGVDDRMPLLADASTPLIAEDTASKPTENAASASVMSFYQSTLNRDVHAEAKSEEVARLHASAEIFDEKTEQLFSYLQVATACFASFAHGANDVSNSVAPFTMIYYIYMYADIPAGDYAPPVWILVMGGIGIVAGLALYGYKLIIAIGTNLIKMTPSRGFAIELATAATVVMASMIGIPISSTHCQVGATVAVGACEGKSGFNLKLFTKTFSAWIITIFFAGAVSAGIFSLAYFSPAHPDFGSVIIPPADSASSAVSSLLGF
ncbi:hypothetical protein H696_00043 [Fonticula alba]|uniref:Phosphate transporter n=1 Tax=Fonticula alba TaxID=691883 RepID=A0A058ZES7_FONAL|nr:hypothetical protein H696_00043 [Fonticula alba]KCV72451.1 hypothetical protein H696_00043 [Fonticula alba]|eukprot:XP_009492152.1 hypothetical protein H696_00043 [Fonticula alba]